MGSERFYKVRQGDTYEGLSVRFKLPVCMMIRANQITAQNKPKVGDVLWIPPDDFCKNRIHIVKKGENIVSISKEYGVTMQEILRKNKLLHPKQISEGEKIFLPERKVIYTVTAMDTIETIAKRFNVTIEELKNTNHIYSGVYVGMQLIIPQK